MFQTSLLHYFKKLGYDCLSIFKIDNLKNFKILNDDIILIIGVQFFNNIELLNIVKNNKIIVYNTEPLCCENRKKDIFNCLDKLINTDFVIWEYCDYNYNILVNKYKNIKLFPFGYYENYLNRIKLTKKKDIDVLFYGDLTKRRKILMKKLKEKNIKFYFTNKTYDLNKRDNLISRSKIVLDIFRSNNYKCNNLYRLSYLICNKIVILGEYNDNKFYRELKDYIFFSEYDNIINNCINILNTDENILQEKCENAFIFFKNNFSNNFINELKI